jgi:hypothetical protein
MEVTYKKLLAMVLFTVLVLVLFYGTFALVFYPTDENDFIFSERLTELFIGHKPASAGDFNNSSMAGGEGGEERVRTCYRGDMVL